MKKKMKLSRNGKLALQITCGFCLALVMIPMLFAMALSALTVDEVELSEDVDGADFASKVKHSEKYEDSAFYITVYRTESGVFESIAFERYIVGVVAAEMPALFELEALKAQAVAARTYAMRILEHEDYILDSVMHQVFLDDDQLKLRWGDDFDRHFATIERAVNETRGIVITYENQLITPMFFAMSSGATENSEDVFGASRPYLRSVISDGYEHRDDFAVDEVFTIEELRMAFDDMALTKDCFSILTYSQGGNVMEMAVGSRILSGRDVREILRLRSAAFRVDKDASWITFTTYGHGHGVGMSQHGANIRAQNGYSYEEILQHFYQSVALVDRFSLHGE